MKIKNRTHIVNLKKISTVAFVMILILFNSISQGQGQRSQNKESLNDWTKEGLKGKVKSYTQYTYKAFDRFGKIKKGEKSWGELRLYNEKGNLIEENDYRSDGSLDSKHTCKYDEKGNLIEQNDYSYGILVSKTISKYDEKENLIEQNYSHGSGSVYAHTYKYDEKGNLIEENQYLASSLNEKYTYKYDEKGNLIEWNSYYTNGIIESKHTYKYDEKGNLIEIKKYATMYDDEGNISSWWERYTIQYDEQQNWTKRIEFTSEVPQTITEREYQYYE